MRSRHFVLFAFCALAAAPLFAQALMRPGLWETTAKMEMPGMPVQMPETKTTSCITPEQAKTPGDTVANQGGRGRGRGRGNDDCKTSDYRTDGNKTTWKMACTGANAMTGDGEMTFSGDSYSGKTTMSMAQGQMTIQYSGKRLGECKE